MKKILNSYTGNGNNTTTISITKTNDVTYSHKVTIDTEDLFLVLNKTVYVQSNGYAYVKPNHNLAHLVLNHKSNTKTVLDHIDGKRLNNTKANLRTVTQHQNSTNITVVKSNTGIAGIAERKNGNYHYFRASVSDLVTIMSEKGKYGKSAVHTKRYAKQFNISKLGRDLALQQAQEWIQTQKIKFGYISTT